MEEEIDLRPYVEILLKRWYLIIGAAILAGLIAFGVTSLLDPVYEATALVAVTQERLIARFDPRLDTSEEPQPIRALPELAVSSDLLRGVFEKLDAPVEGIESFHDLSSIVIAESGTDPSLINLIVTHRKPADAARVANIWAEAFVSAANDIFGDGNEEDLAFFEDQLAESGEELREAEADLVVFQGSNRQTILSNQIEALDRAQDDFLVEQQELKRLQSNVEDLKGQIANSNESASVSFTDQLTAMLLQLRAFNPSIDLPILLQFNPIELTENLNRDAQIALLNELQNTISSRSIAVEQELGEIEPQLLDLQEQLQETAAEHSRLNLNRDVAQETYLSLARKVDEERITAGDMTRGIKLASRAAVPVDPAGPRKLLNAAIASLVAFFIAIVWVLVSAWWSHQGHIEGE